MSNPEEVDSSKNDFNPIHDALHDAVKEVAMKSRRRYLEEARKRLGKSPYFNGFSVASRLLNGTQEAMEAEPEVAFVLLCLADLLIEAKGDPSKKHEILYPVMGHMEEAVHAARRARIGQEIGEVLAARFGDDAQGMIVTDNEGNVLFPAGVQDEDDDEPEEDEVNAPGNVPEHSKAIANLLMGGLMAAALRRSR